MVYFVIPIYNEYSNISNLKLELQNVLPNEEKFYVFCDDGSRDGSKQKLEEEFKDLAFIVLGDGQNKGPGSAFKNGFNYVVEDSKGIDDIVVTIEADCTSDITLLEKMIAIKRLDFDLVLASVYAQGGYFEKTSWFRKLISSAANIFLRYFFGIKVLTLSSFYRVYGISLLKQLHSKYNPIIKENGFICMLEVLHKSIKLNAKIIEVPTTLKSTKRIGKSKMKIIKTSYEYIKYLIFK